MNTLVWCCGDTIFATLNAIFLGTDPFDRVYQKPDWSAPSVTSITKF